MSNARQRQRSWLAWLGQDFQQGMRRFLRRPGFTLLAVGLATSTAVFTYVNAYQQPFPGSDPEGLNQLYQGTQDAPFGTLSYPDYLDLVNADIAGVEVAATLSPQFAATVRHETLTEVVFGQGFTGNIFPLLRTIRESFSVGLAVILPVRRAVQTDSVETLKAD